MEPAILGYHKVSLDVEPEKIGETRTVYGDETISMETIKDIAKFMSEIGDHDGSNIMNAAKGTLTLEKCAIVAKMIEKHPFLTVVPNDMNKDPKDGNILLTRKMTVGLNDQQIIAAVHEEALA